MKQKKKSSRECKREKKIKGVGNKKREEKSTVVQNEKSKKVIEKGIQ